MILESQKLNQQIESLQTQLHKFPKGKLVRTQNRSRCKWYVSDGHNLTYIPKKDQAFAEQLAQKKYLSLLLKDLLQEKTAIDFYLRHHNSGLTQSQKLLTDSKYQKLLAPYFKPKSQELSDWMNAPYESNPKFPHQLYHKTISGKSVRSKSEALIDMLLHINQIPYRYEYALQLGDVTLYPDFTIRHPKTGQTYYWEHFGRMDDPNYSKNVYSKLQIYNSYGIVPTIQLITTYETKEHPLSSEKIEQIVQEYFL